MESLRFIAVHNFMGIFPHREIGVGVIVKGGKI